MIIENGPYTIYTLTNTVNGKMYIGTTKRKLYQRFNGGRGYEHQKDFYADICKYGWDKFESEVFASKLTEEEAYNMEQKLISKIREADPYLLYNRDTGGKHGKHCEETKKIIRDINVGKITSEETKEKIREARAKQVIPREAYLKAAEKNRGRKMSKEFCENLSKRTSKPVKCIETDIVYSSATAASKELSVSVSAICWNCKGKYSHVKGLHFEYV